jgi:hypothetical protein
MVIASHDRYLIERVTDHVYGMFGDGKLVHLPGGIDEYLARTAPIAATSTSGSAASGSAVPAAKGPAVDSRAAKKELARLERALAKLDERTRKVHAEMAEQASDYEKVTALDEELRGLALERERAEEAWLELAESVEA